MKETGSQYTAYPSDLTIYVNKVYFRGPEYIKAKVTLYANGVIVEDRKTYRLYRNRIGHWNELY